MNYIDYIIVGVYFVAMIMLGISFKKNKAGEDYFLGGRKFGWFTLCLSTMATQLSVISFVSAPAFVGMREGGGMQWLTFEFGVPLAMIVIMVFIAPALYKAGLVSAYSFLEKRFNTSTRLLISGVFIISRSFATGVTVYAMSFILSSILKMPLWQTMILIGVITILYSLEGGMKAVIYSEVGQMIIIVLAIFCIIGFGMHYVGGWESFTQNVDRSRLQAVNFKDFGFNGKEFGVWPMVLGGIFLYSSYYGTDQTQVQRILSAKDLPTVRKLLLFNGLLRFPITLSYCFGGLVVGTFVLMNSSFAEKITKPDLMIPVFITEYLPHGIIGIIVVAILAAGMSSFSSTLNSLSAITMEDFVSRKWNVPKEKYVPYSKLVALGWGIVTMTLAFFVDNIADTVIEAINKISSVFYGPILATFLMALLTKRIKALHANAGLISGVLVNVVLWLFFKNVFWFWWNIIGALVTLGVSFAMSTATTPATAMESSAAVEIRPVFFSKETIILMLFFVAIVVFSIMLPNLF